MPDDIKAIDHAGYALPEQFHRHDLQYGSCALRKGHINKKPAG